MVQYIIRQISQDQYAIQTDKYLNLQGKNKFITKQCQTEGSVCSRSSVLFNSLYRVFNLKL